jgi:HPt (histidine-containing phosphotransfer) domain-containing protein
MLSEHAKKLIAERRRIYIESMPAKRKAIQQCMDQVKTAAQRGETILCEKLFQHVHRLAGSAGSYGFDTLGQAASSVDRYLIANSHRADDPKDLAAKLQKLLTEIDNVIQKNG